MPAGESELFSSGPFSSLEGIACVTSQTYKLASHRIQMSFVFTCYAAVFLRKSLEDVKPSQTLWDLFSERELFQPSLAHCL